MANTSNTVNSTANNYNYTYTTSGTSGQFLTSGSNGTAWATSPNYIMGDGIMKVTGDPATLEVKGKVVINGLDLEERLKTIEKVLCIPERDAIMEAKYPSLKKKFDEYINALEKYKTFERIKGTYD
jgi:hypothetical protein